jgi:hypothetical protein
MALSFLALVGCSKQDTVFPEPNAPVFEAHGTLGNDAFDLVAGDNDAYMFTSTEIHNGVRVFTGRLADGETSVEFGIFDGNLDMPNSLTEVNLQNAVLNFAHRYYDPLAVLTAESIVPNGNASHVEWYINGTFSGSGQISIYEPGKYDVCAHVTFVTGQTEQLCDQIILGYTRSANCSIDLDLSQGDIQASLNTTGESIQSVEWLLNNEVVGTDVSLQQNILYGIGNTLKARVTFDNGVVREKSCFIDGTDPSQWISDFSGFELGSSTSVDPQDYQARLIIENDGKIYKSVQAENEGSTITLLSLESYDDNANGNSVYKATLQIEAIVMEMSTEKLIPVSFTTTLGVEVP